MKQFGPPLSTRIPLSTNPHISEQFFHDPPLSTNPPNFKNKIPPHDLVQHPFQDVMVPVAQFQMPPRPPRLSHFLQYMSGLEVLACSLDIDLNYVTTVTTPTAPFPEPLSKVVATFRGKMQQLFGCIIKDRYKAQQHSLLNPRLPVEFLTKCINSLNKLPNISS